MGKTHTIVFDARMAAEGHTGIRRYSRSLIRAMAPLLAPDERLHVILSPGDAGWLPEGPRVAAHEVPAGYGSLKGYLAAAGLERRLRPQVTHAPGLLTPVRIPGRLVLTVHDVVPVSHPRYSSFWFRLLWRWRGFRAIRRARRIIGISEDTLKTCAKFFGRRAACNGVVIPHGIDDAFRPQSPERVAALRRDYGLPEKFLLYAGSARPHKNLTTLLHAYEMLEPTASAALVLAGAGGDAPAAAARREADQLLRGRQVIWLPEMPDADMPALYSAASVFLFPSLAEGFCFPVLEAMACGTPVICSALGVLKELTGGAAKVVHPTDRQEWSRAIHTAILSMEWHDAYREKGLARAALFTWGRAARETLGVYRQLYPRRPSSQQNEPENTRNAQGM